MTALQRIMGGAELTDDSVRTAIANLTPAQRQQLLAEGQDLKRDLLTKQEHAEERNLYFNEVNRSADRAGLPVDKDGAFLAKKISDLMATSCDDIPHVYLLEALAASPYLIKAAVAEARESAASSTVQDDLAEVEAALSVLKVVGWRDGETASRPPFVRRNLLLLHAHLHREQLRALALGETTSVALAETVDKARRLLDMLLAYCLQVGWVRATLCITELQGLVTNGLWDPTDDECRSHMRTKLGAVGLKLPKISIAGHMSDVAPGERVKLTVTLTRMHAHSPAEMAQFLAATEQELGREQQSEQQHAESAAALAAQPAAPPPAVEMAPGDDAAETRNASLAAAFGGEAAALGKEGWWLVVESLRGPLMSGHRQGAKEEVAHNLMVGRQALSPSLQDPQWCADIHFDAPTTPGEYKVIVHVRSSSMIGVDAKRKVSFSVCASKAKRSLPSSSSGTSTEGTEPCETMEAMDAAIAEIEEECGAGASPRASAVADETVSLQ